ncbi:MAG: hypothetical protein WA749_05220 [Gelidibacter sp.]
MDGSLGHFKATLQRRKERQEKNSGKFGKHLLNSKTIVGAKYDFPELSMLELEKVKSAIREKISTDNNRQWMLIIILLIFTGLIVFGVFKFFQEQSLEWFK